MEDLTKWKSKWTQNMKEAKTNYKTYSLVEPRGITGQKIKEISLPV